MAEELQADYLVVGGGAMGMAFTDVLLAETDATVIMVDRYHQVGGHWNVAYPYVRLHQPSAFYGVNSRDLGSDTIDATGWNEGLYELATNSEVCAYFDQVMQQTFLPSGRVQYFPMCEYTGEGAFHSLVSDASYQAKTRKVVDATYMNVTVPSMREPLYEVAEGVHCEPPNGLPKVMGQYDRYVVVGAGKTGMDACLFLLKNAVDPEAISWIMPRDSWMLDRANIQPGERFAEVLGQGFAQQMQATIEATSIEDLFERLDASGQLIRFDPEVFPTMYRCATVTQAELEQLRRIPNVIRKGRVQRIEQDKISLDQGDIPTSSTTLHVDCTADGLERRPPVPVFDNDTIHLQSVRTCQQVFSAAFIGHVEASYDDDAAKNHLCEPVPHPDDHLDFLRTTMANSRNAVRWAEDAALTEWLAKARLDGFSRAAQLLSRSPEELAGLRQLQAQASEASIANIEKLLASVP
ncbi:MAG: NAD(P)/FAD-dependent oxidoreductase [Pseudomonadota bacterium]